MGLVGFWDCTITYMYNVLFLELYLGTYNLEKGTSFKKHSI